MIRIALKDAVVTWMRNVPLVSGIWVLGFKLVCYLGEFRWWSLDGGSTSLGMSFHRKPCVASSLLSVLPTCHGLCEHSAVLLLAAMLPHCGSFLQWWTHTLWNSKPKPIPSVVTFGCDALPEAMESSAISKQKNRGKCSEFHKISIEIVKSFCYSVLWYACGLLTPMNIIFRRGA